MLFLVEKVRKEELCDSRIKIEKNLLVVDLIELCREDNSSGLLVKMWSITWLLLSFFSVLIRSHDWDIVTRNSNNFLYKGQMVSKSGHAVLFMNHPLHWLGKTLFTFGGAEMIIVVGRSLQFIIRMRKAISGAALLRHRRQPSI